MRAPDPESLSRIEAKVHRDQVLRLRCAACVNRSRAGQVGGEVLYGCAVGERWPEHGICRSFFLDEDA